MKKESTALPMAVAAAPLEVSPYKSAVEELDALRRNFRVACQHYAKRIDMDIIRVRERVAAAGEQQQQKAAAVARGGKARGAASGRAHKDASPGSAPLFDLRDMLTLLRTLELKPLAGRRKDLKKVESLVDELRLLVERWG